MATHQRPEAASGDEITAVTTITKSELGQLPASAQVALANARVEAMVAAKIGEQQWGHQMNMETRRALASYLGRHNLDVTEVDVLGGKIYRNAQFYLNRMAALVAQGIIEYATPDLVQIDERLDGKVEAEAAEISRRRVERIQHGLKDNAKAACVFHLKLVGVGREFVGTAECGGGVRKGDPVGEERPVATAITRAARRALKFAVSTNMLPELAQMERALDDDAQESLTAVMEKHRRYVGEQRAITESLPRPAGDVTRILPATGSGYGAEVDGGVHQPASLHPVLKEKDPYTGKMPMEQHAAPEPDDEQLDREIMEQDERARAGR